MRGGRRHGGVVPDGAGDLGQVPRQRGQAGEGARVRGGGGHPGHQPQAVGLCGV